MISRDLTLVSLIGLVLTTNFIIYVSSEPLPVVEDDNRVEHPPSAGESRGAIFTSNSDDKDTILHELSELNAHKFIGLPLDERVNKTEKEIKLKDCIDYLERFGYLVGDYRGLKEESLKMFIAPSLKIFQSNRDIPMTGICDEQTKMQMAQLRCDFPDYFTEKSTRGKRFVIGNSQWSLSDNPLTVTFSDHSSEMGKDEQEKALMKAAQAWADQSGLVFAKGNSKNAKITIGFANHDGPWGVLGRAWFPKVGKILFERKEKWVTDIPGKGVSSLSFYSVAMHEMGHALGISHSNNQDSIMHAQYQRDVMELRADDIKAIQKLYGPNKKNQTSKPAPNALKSDLSKKKQTPTKKAPSNKNVPTSKRPSTKGRPTTRGRPTTKVSTTSRSRTTNRGRTTTKSRKAKPTSPSNKRNTKNDNKNNKKDNKGSKKQQNNTNNRNSNDRKKNDKNSNTKQQDRNTGNGLSSGTVLSQQPSGGNIRSGNGVSSGTSLTG